MEEEKGRKKEVERQVWEHIEFLRGHGFVVSELAIGGWTRCAGIDEPRGSGSYRYRTWANELREGGVGLVTEARRRGETFKHRTLPKRSDTSFSGLSLRSSCVMQAGEERPQTPEEQRRIEVLWWVASPLVRSAYLERKGVKPCAGLRHTVTGIHGASLVVPMRDEHGVLRGIQYIADEDGRKTQPKGAKMGYFRVGDITPVLRVIGVCEGLATALCVHELTGYPVIVAFSSSGLEKAARLVKARHLEATIVVFGDNDRHQAGNPGRRAAEEAAMAVFGVACIPDFGDIPPSKSATDWLDLRTIRPDAVAHQISSFMCRDMLDPKIWTG